MIQTPLESSWAVGVHWLCHLSDFRFQNGRKGPKLGKCGIFWASLLLARHSLTACLPLHSHSTSLSLRSVTVCSPLQLGTPWAYILFPTAGRTWVSLDLTIVFWRYSWPCKIVALQGFCHSDARHCIRAFQLDHHVRMQDYMDLLAIRTKCSQAGWASLFHQMLWEYLALGTSHQLYTHHSLREHESALISQGSSRYEHRFISLGHRSTDMRVKLAMEW